MSIRHRSRPDGLHNETHRSTLRSMTELARRPEAALAAVDAEGNL
jgi:hypothetical protein